MCHSRDQRTDITASPSPGPRTPTVWPYIDTYTVSARAAAESTQLPADLPSEGTSETREEFDIEWETRSTHEVKRAGGTVLPGRRAGPDRAGRQEEDGLVPDTGLDSTQVLAP